MTTKTYYNSEAESFFENTFYVDMEPLYRAFLRYLPAEGIILDVGCGSGRDALYFSQKGYQVEAFDYSEALVKLAREKTKLDIQVGSFYEITAKNQYAGIWACASLLHCERDRLPEVLQSLIDALQNGGVCYLSFKYGSEDRKKEGRHFTDLNEEQMAQLLKPHKNILLLQQWITSDNRPDRDDEWLNIIFQKRGD